MGVDYYSIPQQVALVTVSLISGLASLLGSCTVLFIILSDRANKLNFVYHRILFAQSIVDCIVSTTLALSFLAVPKGLFWGAQGNTASCEAVGFLTQLLVSQMLYNLGIAVYYLMVIRYDKHQQFCARFVEPLVHSLSLSVPFGFALWALLSSSLNPAPNVGGWCGIHQFPQDCSEDNVECTRGFVAGTIKNCFYLGVVFPACCGIVGSMILIVCHVRGRISNVSRYWTQARLDETARQTLIQSMLYIGTSLLPVALYLISLVIVQQDSIANFAMAFVMKLILPLQGVFNLIIYVRPRYRALRQRHGPTYSRLELFKLIFVHTPPAEHGQHEDDFAPENSLRAHGDGDEI